MKKNKPRRIISAEAKEALYGSVYCDSIATKTKETMTKAEEYSFLIESSLFQQLTKEQQELWRKEIEQAYNAGAELADKTMIEKACKWLEDHIDKDLTIYHAQTWLKRDEFIKKLKQAMEE